jgi:hypothetical protein
MVLARWNLWIVYLLALSLLVASCGGLTAEPEGPAALPEPGARTAESEPEEPTALPKLEDRTAEPESDLHTSPLTHSSPLPTPTPSPTDSPSGMPAPSPSQLVVLHTNDNWGETEPCG